LEGFLVAQLRSGITDFVSESDLEGVLHSCIELKGFLATNMQEMDALNIQVVAALAAQMQQEGMKRRSVKG
jgi:hypothetical protein